jgi:hypothetical protein
MIDALEDVVVTLLIVAGSLAAVMLAAWQFWVWLGDNPLGINGLFRAE